MSTVGLVKFPSKLQPFLLSLQRDMWSGLVLMEDDALLIGQFRALFIGPIEHYAYSTSDLAEGTRNTECPVQSHQIHLFECKPDFGCLTSIVVKNQFFFAGDMRLSREL